MSQGTGIEWTDCTWNPVAGCAPVSAGCANCYAVTMTHRLEAMGQEKYRGLTVLQPNGRRHFNGTVRCDEKALTIPLKWKKPRKVFVNSMSDLFHKDVPFEFIDKVFAVMALCPRHVFQVLTKRPERMAEYLNEPDWWRRLTIAADKLRRQQDEDRKPSPFWPDGSNLPLPNVWLGTSVENQKAADERIPHLLRCPAAVRFLSCEPLLSDVNLRLDRELITDLMDASGERDERHNGNYPFPSCPFSSRTRRHHGIHWVIAGGESGPGSRPCNVAWLRGLRDQCKAAGVPFFLKQLGKTLLMGFDDWNKTIGIERCDRFKLLFQEADRGVLSPRDSHGGDESEWPEDLRVREFPAAAGSEAAR